MKFRLFRFLWLLIFLISPQISATNSSFADAETSVGNSFTAACWGSPDLPILLTPDLFSSAPSPTFTWSATTNHCSDSQTFYQFQIYTDAAGSTLYRQSNQLSVTLYSLSLPVGQYWWRVKVSDRFSYGAVTALRSLTIDDEPPTSSFSSLPPITNQTLLSIDYSTTDGSGSGIDHTDLCYSFNLSPWNCGDYFNFTFPLGEGTYYFDTIAYDLAGNFEKSVDDDPNYIVSRPAVIYDVTPPTTNLTIGGTTTSFNGQNLLSSASPFTLGINATSAVTSQSYDISLPEKLSSSLNFSYLFDSQDIADYDYFLVNILSGTELSFTILNLGNTDFSFPTPIWQSISHSLAHWAGQTISLLFSLTNADSDPFTPTTVDVKDLTISSLDLRLGETVPAEFPAVDLGSGLLTSPPGSTLATGENHLTYTSTDLAGNTEIDQGNDVVVLSSVVLNKIDPSAGQVYLYNHGSTDLALDLFRLDLGTTVLLSGTIPAHASLAFDVALPDNGQIKLFSTDTLLDSTTYELATSEVWQRQSDGLGPWVKLNAPPSVNLEPRLSVGKVTLTISGLGQTLADMSYTVDYSTNAIPQRIAGQILPGTIDSLGTISRDFYLGTCSEGGACILPTGLGTTFVVTFSDLPPQTFTF